ncbi:tagaturonate reductase [Alkalihalobacillus trypoxylicola]|uniref:Altronate oxidoreductase n=1 Tax=Alkalihalobacillus trypoxylicola TaxID=519424 RepID=A0A161QEL9_9BACI|nr:tagaturonate reductase [Alkalihalobacillus trypoxylicola]KYG27007.1 altronate oxidoreductase [Alkalihalobacillus trypoxylicola]
MESLNKKVAIEKKERINYQSLDHLPEKVLQFGEGNFLRGFTDWMLQRLVEADLFQGRVVAIQPTPHGKVVPKLNNQDGLYTLILKGIENNEIVDKTEIMSIISRGINPYADWKEVLEVAASESVEFVFSNTTEAGLTYLKENYNENESPLSFPGKLVACLYHRYQTFKGDPEKGWVIFPCELVEGNGKLLKEIVIQLAEEWEFGTDFIEWLNHSNQFCDTLVDRIVTGYPKDEIEEYQSKLGYSDQLLTVGEPYHLFAIDADEKIAQSIPFDRAGLNVKWGDITPFRELKVRLLNGPHTLMFAVSYLTGVNTVLEAMEHPLLRKFVEVGMLQEIYPFVKMEENEKKEFSEAVIERFLNPFNKHQLADIGLNAAYKFKTRLLPTLLEFESSHAKLPNAIVFSLAALLAYYKPKQKEGEFFIGENQGRTYQIRDNPEILSHIEHGWQKVERGELELRSFIQQIFADSRIWGQDLNEIKDLTEQVNTYLSEITHRGVEKSLETFFN